MTTRAVSASRLALLLSLLADVALAQPAPTTSPAPPHYIAVRAGKLIDPATGTVSTDQIILVKDRKFEAIGPKVAIPAGAEVIDLSGLTVLPGLVDAHNHLAITYKVMPERNDYYVTVIKDSTPLRAIQAASNGIQMLAAGFTIVRDMGNNGLYADTALRQAIEEGWVPGPQIINAGIIIGSTGGQFWPTPEMGLEKKVVFPEYLDADTPDELVKAVRQNMLYGAKVIKICADCKPWGYSVDDIKIVVAEEAAREGRPEGGGSRPDGGGRAPCDRGRRLVHRPRPRPRRREPQAHGEAGHLPRRDGDAALPHRPPDREGLQARRGQPEERLREQGQHDLLHRRRLLGAGKDAR